MNDSWFELLDALPDERCRRSLERLLDHDAFGSGSWRYVRTPSFTSTDYVVVDTGHVLSLPRYVVYGEDASGLVTHEKFRPGKLLSPGCNARGHRTLTLMHEKQPYKTYVHQLVAWAFIGSQSPDLYIHHRDGDPANNRAENLCYRKRGPSAHPDSDDVLHHLTIDADLLGRMRAAASSDVADARVVLRTLLDRLDR